MKETGCLVTSCSIFGNGLGYCRALVSSFEWANRPQANDASGLIPANKAFRQWRSVAAINRAAIMLPFTVEQFLGIFASYNKAIWPAQILAYLLGGLAFALVFRKGKWSDQIIAGILAVMWAWTGIAYHLTFFTAINKMAFGFGALFVVQAAAFVYAGVYQGRMVFNFNAGLAGWTGVAFVFYAAALYPLLGLAMGHHTAELPMFGVTPCPVTIFTFGMLLLTGQPVPRLLLVIPFLWSLVGGSAAILLRVPQDWLLLVSGVVSVALLIRRDRRLAPAY